MGQHTSHESLTVSRRAEKLHLINSEVYRYRIISQQPAVTCDDKRHVVTGFQQKQYTCTVTEFKFFTHGAGVDELNRVTVATRTRHMICHVSSTTKWQPSNRLMLAWIEASEPQRKLPKCQNITHGHGAWAWRMGMAHGPVSFSPCEMSPRMFYIMRQNKYFQVGLHALQLH